MASEERKRDVTQRVRVSRLEDEQWRAAAARERTTVSALMRTAMSFYIRAQRGGTITTKTTT